MYQVFPIESAIHSIHIKNDKTGKVHEFYSEWLDDPTDGPRGRTRCGIEILDEADWEITSEDDPVTCKNCNHPGHNNLWKHEEDGMWENPFS